MASLPASEFRVGIAMACGCAAQGTISSKGQAPVVGCLVHGCTEVADEAHHAQMKRPSRRDFHINKERAAMSAHGWD